MRKRSGLKEIRRRTRQRRLQWLGYMRRETEVLRIVKEMEIFGRGNQRKHE